MISHRADPGDFSRETLRQPPLRVACHGPLQRDFTTCDIHVHIPGIQILTGGKVSVNPIVDGEITTVKPAFPDKDGPTLGIEG